MPAVEFPSPNRTADLRLLVDVLNEALALEGVASTKRERIVHHVLFGTPRDHASLGLPGSHYASVEFKVSEDALRTDYPSAVPEALLYGVPDLLRELYRRAGALGNPHFDQPHMTSWSMRFDVDAGQPYGGPVHRLVAMADVALRRKSVGPAEMASAVDEMLRTQRMGPTVAAPLPPLAGEATAEPPEPRR